MEFESIHEILEFAVSKEEASVQFYKDLASKMGNSATQSLFEVLVQNEKKHIDSLRLEMGYALYGNDLDDGTSPLEAGLSWLVKLGKGEFVGREALQAQKDSGLTRRLRGFRLAERGFPRPGYDVVFRGDVVGAVRSGTLSPSLDVGIGTAYLPPDAEIGDEVAIRIRGRDLDGQVVQMPFYRDGSVRK